MHSHACAVGGKHLAVTFVNIYDRQVNRDDVCAGVRGVPAAVVAQRLWRHLRPAVAPRRRILRFVSARAAPRLPPGVPEVCVVWADRVAARQGGDRRG